MAAFFSVFPLLDFLPEPDQEFLFSFLLDPNHPLDDPFLRFGDPSTFLEPVITKYSFVNVVHLHQYQYNTEGEEQHWQQLHLDLRNEMSDLTLS